MGDTCFICQEVRTDKTEGYEALVDDEPQGWICGACVNDLHRKRQFRDAMKGRSAAVGFYHYQRFPDGRILRTGDGGLFWDV